MKSGSEDRGTSAAFAILTRHVACAQPNVTRQAHPRTSGDAVAPPSGQNRQCASTGTLPLMCATRASARDCTSRSTGVAVCPHERLAGLLVPARGPVGLLALAQAVEKCMASTGARPYTPSSGGAGRSPKKKKNLVFRGFQPSRKPFQRGKEEIRPVKTRIFLSRKLGTIAKKK